jgi:nucleotide-binding universal stress UspA family protein
MFSPIVVPVDASDASNEAAKLAIALAKSNSASIVFINVIDVSKLMALSGYESPYPGEAIDQMRDSSTKILDEAIALAAAAGVTATSETAEGDAADEIVAAAEQHRAGLIVIGTHGRQGLARLFIGSVAEAVLRRAHCPVLATRGAATA